MPELRFQVSEKVGSVSALLLQPGGARWLLALGHGAGAGMRHPFLEAACSELARQDIATFRYQFPYMERGSRRVDPRPVLLATVRAAIGAAAAALPNLPLLAGGKSMGGRMTSMAAAQAPLPGVRGIVFFGFPLHPASRPSTERAEHLDQVQVPMLFLQGRRDRLAELGLLTPICDRLGARAELHVFENADHSFHLPRRGGAAEAPIIEQLARTVREWAAQRS